MVSEVIDPSQLRRVSAVVVGASAGAIETLLAILPLLPASLRVPIVVVIHIPQNQRPSMLGQIFRPRCLCPVYEISDKEPLTSGVWFAPPDYHVLVESDRSFSLSVDAPVNYSRPSVDVLFESAADVYGNELAGVVLTGASSDGANGARAIREAGGLLLVQDPATAVATTMPLSAIEKGRPQVVAPAARLAELLLDMTRVE